MISEIIIADRIHRGSVLVNLTTPAMDSRRRGYTPNNIDRIKQCDDTNREPDDSLHVAAITHGSF